MHTLIGGRSALVATTFAIKLNLILEAGVWVACDADGVEHAVTSLAGIVDTDGVVHFGIPKGVRRRPSGGWSAREQLLLHALPMAHPHQAWAAVPAAVRGLIEDSYLLAREETPEIIGSQL